MLPRDVRRILEQVERKVNELLTVPGGLRDRFRWLALFDLLDELKEDLLAGNGLTWPPSVREVYVKVRTGLKELFELLLQGRKFPLVYARDRLTHYRDRLREVIDRLAPAHSGTST